MNGDFDELHGVQVEYMGRPDVWYRTTMGPMSEREAYTNIHAAAGWPPTWPAPDPTPAGGLGLLALIAAAMFFAKTAR